MSWGQALFLSCAFIALLLASLLGWFLQPQQPNFASDSGYQEQAASYRAGGADCDPSKIGALPIRLRAHKADTCAEAEEQHREGANNFIENRRAAVAAEASATYTADQARIEAWGAAIGLVTLFAAFAAAVFAERAAHHTKRAATAAETALEEGRDTTYRQLRAYISPAESTLDFWLRENDPGIVWMTAYASIMNTGLTPATITKQRAEMQVPGKGAGWQEITDPSILAPRGRHYVPPLSGSEVISDFPKALMIRFLFSYTDYLGRSWTETMEWRSDMRIEDEPKLERQTVRLILMSHTARSGS